MAAVANNKTEKGPIMFSYCDCNKLASYVYQYLKKKLEWPVWMDKVDAHASLSSR